VVFLTRATSSPTPEALDEKYGGEDRENGEEGRDKDKVDVHGCPFASGGSQAWIVAPIETAAMSLIAERGPNVGFRWKNVVRVWLVRDECFDWLDEGAEGDEEEESGGVMIGCVGEEKKQDGD
jgi:hypothetical protein